MLKKIIYLLVLVFFAVSCADSLDSVKRGLTGQKRNSTDEFLIQKKDPLILPPDYENLPDPNEKITANKEISTFKKNLGTLIEDGPSTPNSVEDSILKKIQSK